MLVAAHDAKVKRFVYAASSSTYGDHPDVRHSLADISKAATLLCYQPTHRIGEGMKVAMEWYIQHLTQQCKAWAM